MPHDMTTSNKELSSKTINSLFTDLHSIIKDNEVGTTILWFDSNLSSDEYLAEIRNRFQQINVFFYTDLELCLNYVRSNVQEQILLVISDSNAAQLLPHTVKLHQIDAIFIISTEKTEYEHLTTTYPQITGIYTDLDSLCASIQEKIDFNDKHLLTFSSFDQNQTSIQHISKESAQFLWFQLFKHVILHLPHNQQLNTSDSLIEQTLIDQFERDYQPKEAIRWYLKQSFISKFMTKALRNQDIDQLRTLGFFIADLTKHLAYEHHKILSSNEQILIVYRGTKLTKKQLQKFKKTQGALISMNNYLSTNRLYKSALAVAMKPTKRTDIIPVLFEIKCNVQDLGETIVFADIAQYSENEVLFDINTTFRLKSIQRHEQIWLVKMNASNAGQTIAKNYLEEKYRETEEKSLCIVFGRLMCSLGQYDKAQKYFEQLSSEQNGEDLAWIEFNLGRTHDFKDESKIAEEYYNRAYDRMMNDQPTRWKEAVYILNKLGIILHDKGKNDKALDYYQQAWKIQQKFNCSDRVNNARVVSNIALTLNVQGNHNEALDYHQQALNILKKNDTSDHIDVARNLNNIGNILYQKGKYEEAADHYQRALTIQENLYPSGRIDTAKVLNNIGLILNMQGKYNDALGLCQHALKMQEKLYPSGHIDTAGSYNNIGLILYNRGQYDEALYYHQQAFKMRQKNYPSGHVDIARSLNNIGSILYQQCKYAEALKYYLQTLSMQEKFYSPDHVDIALCLNNIGCTLDKQGKYNEALHYHQNALKIQQKLYTSGHPDMAYSFSNIGNILYQQEKYNEALVYYQRALQIQDKFHPSDHVNIGDNLNNIAMTYAQMEKLKISLTYFRRALVLYKKTLPSGHANIETVQRNISRITSKK